MIFQRNSIYFAKLGAFHFNSFVLWLVLENGVLQLRSIMRRVHRIEFLEIFQSQWHSGKFFKDFFSRNFIFFYLLEKKMDFNSSIDECVQSSLLIQKGEKKNVSTNVLKCIYFIFSVGYPVVFDSRNRLHEIHELTFMHRTSYQSAIISQTHGIVFFIASEINTIFGKDSNSAPVEMYPSSSQRRFWTFKNEQEIEELRLKHNQQFVRQHGDALGLNVSCNGFDGDWSVCWIRAGSFGRKFNGWSTSLLPRRKECFWRTMSYIWRIFVVALSRRCQNASSAPHFTISNVSIWIIHQWTITRKRFC